MPMPNNDYHLRHNTFIQSPTELRSLQKMHKLLRAMDLLFIQPAPFQLVKSLAQGALKKNAKK